MIDILVSNILEMIMMMKKPLFYHHHHHPAFLLFFVTAQLFLTTTTKSARVHAFGAMSSSRFFVKKQNPNSEAVDQPRLILIGGPPGTGTCSLIN